MQEEQARGRGRGAPALAPCVTHPADRCIRCARRSACARQAILGARCSSASMARTRRYGRTAAGVIRGAVSVSGPLSSGWARTVAHRRRAAAWGAVLGVVL